MTDVLAELAAVLAASESVLLTAHVNPDGDAFGSELALAFGLESLGKRVRIVNDQSLPERFRTVLPAERIEVLDDPAALAGEAFDCCVLLDTSEPDRCCAALRPLIFAPGQTRVCLDHHRVQGEYSYDSHVVASCAPATGSLVLALLDVLGVAVDRPIARALWIAIATDTGWFRFANTDARALADAARLAGYDIDPEGLWGVIYGGHSVGRTRLYGEVLASMESDLDGNLVWAVIRQAELQARGVALAELDGVVDALKAVRGVRVAALVTERGQGFYKVSLRAMGDAEVETIARSFGGGGHAKAAGFGFEGALDELVAALRKAVAGGLGAAEPAAAAGGSPSEGPEAP